MTGRISSSGEASSELKLSLTVHLAHLASGPADHAARSSDQHWCLTRPCRGSGARRLLQGWGSTALPVWLDDCICSFLFPRQTDKSLWTQQGLQTGCSHSLTAPGQIPKSTFADLQNTICKAHISSKLWGRIYFLVFCLTPRGHPACLGPCHSYHCHISCYQFLISLCLPLKGHLVSPWPLWEI